MFNSVSIPRVLTSGSEKKNEEEKPIHTKKNILETQTC
jgi:hypothetical protein